MIPGLDNRVRGRVTVSERRSQFEDKIPPGSIFSGFQQQSKRIHGDVRRVVTLGCV